jgi:hypothetical protein
LVFDRQDPEAGQRAQACWDDLLQTGRAAGFFPYRFPISGMAQLRQWAPESAAFNRKLHETFDPHGLIAPGRYR